MNESLRGRLAEFFGAIAANCGIRPSADDDLTPLEAVLGTVPGDIEAWFSTHAGQEPLESIGVGMDARRLLSVQEALAARDFLLQEYPKRYNPSWLPLLTNDGGDYWVYLLDADGQPQIGSFYHDDERFRIAKLGIEGLIADWEADWEDEKEEAGA